MTDPTARNRLDAEASPYLRQHADNPVNWQPWDDDALEAAKERDVPIFLSVGYAACHWCHVMEEESFEDEAVAEVLNDDFVPIKVDREERPDLDSVYQTACQLVSGRGGWPLSAWLTPEGEPFYVGTYFPRGSRQGMPGFLDLLNDITESWSDPEEREEFEQRASRITSRIREELEDTDDAGGANGSDLAGGGEPDPAADGVDGPLTAEDQDPGEAVEEGPTALERAASTALRNADRQHGGWGQGPKFPQPARVEALLEAGWEPEAAVPGSDDGESDDAEESSEFHAAANAALAAMVDGGLYDHVGGGFHRYCTDQDWTVPHFEKMLYDNAEIPRVLLAAHQLTGHERYATVARETFDFLNRELAHSDGAFAATLDARSAVPAHRTEDGEPGEHEEGEFYVWTPAEVREALEAAGNDADLDDSGPDAPLADLVCDRYGITAAGNFEGKTVLTIDASIEDLADAYDLEPAAVRERLDTAREVLRDVREERPRPRRDDKVIAGWNGLAIRALAEGAIVLEEDDLADRATTALDAVRDNLWDGDRLARRYVPMESENDPGSGGDGGTGSIDVQGRGYLEDYAFLGRGALACYEATGEVEPLAFALELGETIVEQFYDDAAATLYSTPAGGEDLIARPQEPRDQSTPSSLAVGTDLLLALDAFRSDDRFDRVARRVLSTHASRLEKRPLEHPSLALAAERGQNGSTEVTIAAGETAVGSAERGPWSSWLAERYLPRRLVAPRPTDAEELERWLDRLSLAETPPIWAGRDAADAASGQRPAETGDQGAAETADSGATEPTGYVCRQFTCSRPLTDPADADAWLQG